MVITSCVNEDTSNSILDNTKWKVSKTTYESIDGTTQSFTEDNDGGFYITFNKTGEFNQEWYPYSSSSNGYWKYFDGEKKLSLMDRNDNPFIEYTVLQLTTDNLTLYSEKYSQDINGFVKLTLELKPY